MSRSYRRYSLAFLALLLGGCVVMDGGGPLDSSPTPTSSSTPTPTPTGTATPVPTPTPGYPIAGNLYATTNNDHQVSLQWGDSIDDQTTQFELVYAAFLSTAANISTVADIDAHGTPLASGVHLLAGSASNLKNAKEYWFNVTVQDQDGHRSAYSMVSTTTFSHLYVYASDPIAGSSVGGRAGADAICAAKAQSSFPQLNCPFVKAFLSVTTTDSVFSLAVPHSTAVVSATTGVTFLNNWTDIGNVPPQVSAVQAGIVSGASPTGYEPWSGSSSDGTYFSGTDECAGFTGGSYGYVANGISDVVAWLGDGGAPCSEAHPLLCLCWAQ